MVHHKNNHVLQRRVFGKSGAEWSGQKTKTKKKLLFAQCVKKRANYYAHSRIPTVQISFKGLKIHSLAESV